MRKPLRTKNRSTRGIPGQRAAAGVEEQDRADRDPAQAVQRGIRPECRRALAAWPVGLQRALMAFVPEGVNASPSRQANPGGRIHDVAALKLEVQPGVRTLARNASSLDQWEQTRD